MEVVLIVIATAWLTSGFTAGCLMILPVRSWKDLMDEVLMILVAFTLGPVAILVYRSWHKDIYHDH